MVDIETWRKRIGSSRSRTRNKKTNTPKQSWSSPFIWKDEEDSILPGVTLNINWKVAIVCLGILLVWSPNDDRYGKNRQRGNNFKEFRYSSEEEKKLFNATRTTESNFIRSESHLHFFKECQKEYTRQTSTSTITST